MSAIDVQNALQIRDPMIVLCGISARMSVNLTVSDVSGFYLIDTNPSVSIDSEEWPIRQLADLQGEGFRADGSCEFYDSTAAGSSAGKIGARTHIGGTGSLTVTAASEVPALTIYTSGEGTITANGTTYEARGVNVIAVNSTSVTLTFASTDAEKRMELQSITPGISISWDNDTLISAELNLRSDLSIKEPQWAVSEIEIQAYYPDDISEAISNVADDVPIWYTAGYTGDMCPQRQFYLSEPATMENNIITIKGHDASHKLGEKSSSALVLNTTANSGRYYLYGRFVNTIKGAGIKLQNTVSYPSKTSGGTGYTLITRESSADNLVQDVMNLAHHDTFWPTFVDAGIPSVYWEKPTSKWDIYEEDCGDIVREVDRNIAKITTTDEFGLHNRAVRSTKVQTLQTKNIAVLTRYSYEPGGYWWYLTCSNATNVSTTAEKIWWTASKLTEEITRHVVIINQATGQQTIADETTYKNQCVVKGKAITIAVDEDSVTPDTARAGSTVEMSPTAYGKVYQGSTLLYPNYKYLFERSNITGSFKWKGDPRMQPRDVFTFHRLDGTTEDCTIESICLRHDGGTVADITYRKGVC